MTVFVTVGFENFPFNRLIQVMDEGVERGLIPRPILIQTGHSRYEPRFCLWERFLPFDKMMSYLRRADIIVCHGGVGTTLLALSLGKIPILFPRQARYHEHVDDHQKEFVSKMVELGKVLAAYEGTELIRLIKNYASILPTMKPSHSPDKGPCLRDHLEAVLCSYGRGKERRG